MINSRPKLGLSLASPHHRKLCLGRLNLIGLSLRLAAVLLLGPVIWIHLHLWQEGYKYIPTIGPLFLVAAVSTLVAATILLVRPSRLIGLLAMGIDLGILGSLIVSVNAGLFGFKETLGAPFVGESFVLEALAATALAGWVACDYAAERQPYRTPLDTHDDAELWEKSWKSRAHQAEADADDLAHALDFHIVNECDCHGAADTATLRRHDIRAVARRSDLADAGYRPVVDETKRASSRRRRVAPIIALRASPGQWPGSAS